MIKVESIASDKYFPKTGEKMTITATVVNTGATTQAVTFDIYIDGKEKYKMQAVKLEPDEPKVLNWYVTINDGGTHTVCVRPIEYEKNGKCITLLVRNAGIDAGLIAAVGTIGALSALGIYVAYTEVKKQKKIKKPEKVTEIRKPLEETKETEIKERARNLKSYALGLLYRDYGEKAEDLINSSDVRGYIKRLSEDTKVPLKEARMEIEDYLRRAYAPPSGVMRIEES